MSIKLQFLGAVQNVTGSRHLLEVNGTKLLVDCGLYQERQFQERNWEKFTTPPESINTVLLTHAHLDHCGLLPRLVKEGFKGKICCTAATAEIAKIILLDSAKLQVEDAEFKRKRHAKEGRKGPHPEEPLYNVAEAEACFPLFKTIKYDNPVEIVPGIEAVFHEAGHVLGSSVIKVKLTDNDKQVSVLFSGDIGRPNRPILRDPALIDDADYMLVESTYGDRVHEPPEDIEKKIADVINSTKQAGGNIIIPSFALERSQEVLYYINELLRANAIPHLMVFLDSPMAASITKVFKRHDELYDKEMTEYVNNHQSPFNFPGLTIVESTDQSKAINHIRGTVMVIAGSGMCTGGRVKHHLVNNISKSENTIMFVGYQAQGTLGRRIVDGEKEVRILGQKRHIKANIVRIHGFSAHADKEEILEWLRGVKKPPKNIFVVHGETQSSQHFASYIGEKTGWKITVPEYQQEVILD
ncbi:MBL fold metallo-hydrolase RNA specificity domain-containing protein [Planctomycetota bacterium]